MNDKYNRLDLSYLLKEHSLSLKQKDREFLGRVYSTPLNIYLDRLRRLGFVGGKNVLDAGAGFGQWSIALAILNNQVTSIEYDQSRVSTASAIADFLQVDNLTLERGSIEELPYANESFDCVYCYGVVFLTDWKKSLAQLARVLKPGGSIYINFNGPGWYQFLLDTAHNASSDYDPKAVAAQAFKNTVKYSNSQPISSIYTDVIVERIEAIKECLKHNLIPISIIGEGKSELGEHLPEKTFFKSRYNGQDCVFEVVAKRL